MKKSKDPVASLATTLKGRDVRAIVRGALDGKTFWILFGPGNAHDYRVENFVWRRGGWHSDGDCASAGDTENDGWDMLGALFVRAFTEAS